jgi:hypothetical protein
VIYDQINPPDSWQPYAAAVDSQGFSYISGNRGLFLFAPSGNLYRMSGGKYRHLAAIGHNRIFAGLNPATIEYLSGFPAYSEGNLRFYGLATMSTPDEIRSWVPSRRGQVLRVEYTEDLAAPEWTELPLLIRTGLITEVRLAMTNRTVIYRLRADP